MDHDKRHEKSWNDPPMFSMEQLSQASSGVPLNKRYRYPQQAAAPAPAPTQNQGFVPNNQMQQPNSYFPAAQQQQPSQMPYPNYAPTNVSNVSYPPGPQMSQQSSNFANPQTQQLPYTINQQQPNPGYGFVGAPNQQNYSQPQQYPVNPPNGPFAGQGPVPQVSSNYQQNYSNTQY